ncbi:uncharacterized protein N0V89_003240 [Didymosphaeria variabile]|uniref:Uncharacterized protein n=1 Tax=Didymosphaeria variabile TaxID=1932322 RepID=A0A9W9CEE1_9PLEO|nr:uncharacterized protein N0V89_003240 [Didymosphaeria variabile]KAJ4358656.1 hypothetical protein N0V89_003240 [Didymosphaeria variabile]
MPPKRAGKHKPANIIVGQQRPSGPTFNDTSLAPFLRAYTRMNSRDAGGGDRQFNEEFYFAQRIVEELNRLRDAPPEFIHDVVYSMASTHGDEQPLYPTLRSQGANDQMAYQNRIIISVLLMMHASNDFQNGGDGGVTRGGLWLPPRLQARTAQDAAAERGQPVRYPTWSRDEAQASTPSVRANWTSSGQPPTQHPQAGSLRPQGSKTFENRTPGSAVGSLPPFSGYTPSPYSPYGPPSARTTYGPPSGGLGGYNSSHYGPQQWPSNSSLRGEYGVPPPHGFQPPHYVQDTLRTIPSHAPPAFPQANELVPYNYQAGGAHELSGHPFRQTSHPGGRPIIPPPPGLEGADHLSAFGSETNSPGRPAQPPIGSDRPHYDSRRDGGSRSSRGDNTGGTPSRPAPGSASRSGGSRSRREDQGWH